ncbi:MAG: bifunctional 4-hydroxy-2-oxoglutarate aldolase/2-dehydro-3-deoxy-phosphogluconate aldolase [Aeoliella sp.]
MSNVSPIDIIRKLRLVPVIVCDDPTYADDLAGALVEGGLPLAEVTLRTPTAFQTIERMAACNNVMVGAGTVLSVEQAEQAIDSGAQFIVSPGLDESVVRHCQDRRVPVLPGVATATELQRAINMGLDLVKFFPAQAIGGVGLLNYFAGPFPQMKFMPTGGITLDNLLNYLRQSMVVACGGNWMVKRDWIKEEKFQAIAKSVREAVDIIRSI